MTFKELRENAGLRQVDVAAVLDVNQAAVSHWEHGRTRPAKKYRKKLADLFSCSVETIDVLFGKA